MIKDQRPQWRIEKKQVIFDMDILKFLTAGSVDDGKSTLIGCLLYHTQSLKKDRVEAVSKISQINNESKIDYALFSDGLHSEREQGITIDVSYQYFSSPSRRFVIADCPGHERYTRNMFTGASQSDLIVLLVNAENGLQTKTKRHIQIAKLLDFDKVIVCINKMDLIAYDEALFNSLCSQIESEFNKHSLKIYFVPTCAIHGDNVVHPSTKMPWYKKESLIEILDQIEIKKENDLTFRFPIQMVQNVKNDSEISRYLLGNVSGNGLKVGDEVKIMPQKEFSQISAIHIYKDKVARIGDGQFCALTLKDDIDVARGNIIVKKEDDIKETSTIIAEICWMDETPLNLNTKYILKYGTSEVQCKFNAVTFLADDHLKNEKKVLLNSIFSASIKMAKPIAVDQYRKNKRLGGIVIINPSNNNTIAGGVIIE